MSNNHRFLELDLFRFCAAIMVVFYHYCFRGFAADDMSVVSFTPIDSIAKYGYLGVELFFMISGFVILYSAQHGSAAKFTISRIARLYPTFWVCVLLTAIATVWLGGERYQVDFAQVVINLTMIPEVLDVEYVDGVYWTLLVELKFYLIILCILAVRAMRFLLPFLYIWLAIAGLHFFVPLPSIIEFYFIPSNASLFIAGCAFFLAYRDGFKFAHIALIIAALAVSGIYSIRGVRWVMEPHYQAEFNIILVSAILISFHILFFLLIKGKLRFLNWRYSFHLGALTYPIYLIHQNLGFMIFNAVGDSIPKWLLLTSVILGMAWLSWLIHIHIEKRFGPKLKKALENLYQRLGILPPKPTTNT